MFVMTFLQFIPNLPKNVSQMFFQVTGQFHWLLHLTLAMDVGSHMHCLVPYVGLVAGTTLSYPYVGKRLHECLYPLY